MRAPAPGMSLPLCVCVCVCVCVCMWCMYLCERKEDEGVCDAYPVGAVSMTTRSKLPVLTIFITCDSATTSSVPGGGLCRS